MAVPCPSCKQDVLVQRQDENHVFCRRCGFHLIMDLTDCTHCDIWRFSPADPICTCRQLAIPVEGG
jgi:hypothetical protein